MQDYIVSARKYRPMTFDTVVGQAALTTTLRHAVDSRKLAHAYLFCGPRGVGKTTCARIFAKAINCENPVNGEACNECESCKAFNEQRSYNIFELDAASNNGVEHIKHLMEQTRIPPQVGRYKVFIIDEVHMLSSQAFNAFLKTLEEPPAHVIFILATTEKHKILPTIISRCQIYDFERISVPAIVDHLKMVAEKEGVEYEEDALHVIAEKADGGMRDALSVFDQAVSFCQGPVTYAKVLEDLNVLDLDIYFRFIDLALDNNVPDIMLLLDEALRKGFDGGQLINGLARHARNLMVARDERSLKLLETSENHKTRYREQAARCQDRFLYRALQIMNRCDQEYRQSSNKRLIVELTLIEVAQITQEDDTPAAGRRPDRLKTLFRNIVKMVQSANAAPQVAATAQRPLHTARNNRPTTEPQSPTPAPRLKLGGIGTSFSRLKDRQDASVPTSSGNAATPAKEEAQRFTKEDLMEQWQAMCRRMQVADNEVAIAARMLNMAPMITDYPHVSVSVDNQLLLQQMNAISGRIRNTLVHYLHNKDITFTVRLAEAQEVTQVYSKKERFETLATKNPAIGKLQSLLDLELS